MTLKTFLIGMLVSFGLAWMCMIAVPAAKMSALPKVKIDPDDEESANYQRMIAGRIHDGSRIYAKNGCYYCHSQLIRPTYLGRQIWRDDVAGVIGDDGDTRRETSYYDYDGEKYAQIGRTRMGPDLSNFGHRAKKYAQLAGMNPEQWVMEHLYNPRNNALFLGKEGQKLNRNWSNCPSQPQMFDEVPLNGQGGSLALTFGGSKTTEIVPNEQARLLAGYLLSLKRDDTLPKQIAHPVKGEEGNQEKK